MGHADAQRQQDVIHRHGLVRSFVHIGLHGCKVFPAEMKAGPGQPPSTNEADGSPGPPRYSDVVGDGNRIIALLQLGHLREC